MNLYAETEVYNACRLLFGSNLTLNHDFLRYLQPAGAKTAYRQRAKENHPDRFHNATPLIYRQKVKNFQDLNQAYELLLDFLSQRRSHILPLTPAASPAGYQRSRPRPRTAKPAPAERSAEPMPGRILEFGLFLYYRGHINFRQLIEALAWQRRQRPNLGDIAERWGWLSAPQVQLILRHRSATGYYRRFGEKALELHLLDQRQLQTLLTYQRSVQRRIGEFFVEHGLLTQVQLQRLLQEHQQHNRQFTTASWQRAF